MYVDGKVSEEENVCVRAREAVQRRRRSDGSNSNDTVAMDAWTCVCGWACGCVSRKRGRRRWPSSGIVVGT
jgi:hypothetical protein